MTLQKIALTLKDGAPTKEETLWAFPMGGGLYRLDNSPWFANGCALGDVVKCADREGQLPLFERVVMPSGNLAVRIFVPAGPERDATKQEVFEFLRRTGCKFEGFGTDKGLIAVTIPKNIEPEIVLAPLREYQAAEKAYWESANF